MALRFHVSVLSRSFRVLLLRPFSSCAIFTRTYARKTSSRSPWVLTPRCVAQWDDSADSVLSVHMGCKPVGLACSDKSYSAADTPARMTDSRTSADGRSGYTSSSSGWVQTRKDCPSSARTVPSPPRTRAARSWLSCEYLIGIAWCDDSVTAGLL